MKAHPKGGRVPRGVEVVHKTFVTMQASNTIVSSSREQRDAADFVGGTNVVLVANYGSERPPLSDKRSYGCTRQASAASASCTTPRCASCVRLILTLGPQRRQRAHVAQRRLQLSGVCGRRTRGIVRALTASLEEGRFALTEVTHIMVDEAQDMKPLFYRLICRLVSMARSPDAHARG
jgi:hypothetical protein